LQEYDEGLLNSLSKKYQIFLDSPNGEINVFLVLNNNENNTKDEFSDPIKSHISDNELNYKRILNQSLEKNLSNSNDDTNKIVTEMSKSEEELEMEIEEEELSGHTHKRY